MKTVNYYKNININYLFVFVKYLNVTQGIWMIYLVSKGMSLFQVGLLEGIFHLTSFLMETPTGAVADIFGRKVSRIIGIIFSIISSIVLILSNTFWGFAFSFVVSALSYNFESGAGEALVYDSLVIAKKEDQFMKITGRIESIFQITGIIALTIGGVIGSISYTDVFMTSILIGLIALMISLFFKEPILNNKKKEKVSFAKAIKAQYKDSINIIKDSKRLAYLIIFSSLLFTFIAISFFYLQVAWKASGYIEWEIGVFLAIAGGFGVIGALLAVRIDKRFGEKRVLKYSPIFVLISILLLYFIKVSMISFCIISFVDSIIFVATRDYINKLIPSEKRATILSFESTMYSFFMICLFPIFGAVSDNIGMQITFVILGFILLVFSVINIRVLSRNNIKA